MTVTTPRGPKLVSLRVARRLSDGSRAWITLGRTPTGRTTCLVRMREGGKPFAHTPPSPQAPWRETSASAVEAAEAIRRAQREGPHSPLDRLLDLAPLAA